jgi:hypothetical protein
MLLFLMLLVIVQSQIVLTMDSMRLTHCQVKKSHIFVPSMIKSKYATTTLTSSPISKIFNCAQICQKSAPCQTAVLNVQRNTCTMFSETVATSGSIVPDSNAGLITIIVEKLTGNESDREIMLHFLFEGKSSTDTIRAEPLTSIFS